jgi:choline dehydrogenase
MNLSASGVYFVNSRSGERFVSRARKEICLCAGSLGNVQILERSGVGRADLLASLGE